jgi:hypothetical protein
VSYQPDGSKDPGDRKGFLCRHCIIIVVIVAVIAATIGFVAGEHFAEAPQAKIGHP